MPRRKKARTRKDGHFVFKYFTKKYLGIRMVVKGKGATPAPRLMARYFMTT
jgi:hypothetical protein